MAENEKTNAESSQLDELKARLLKENPHLKDYPHLFLRQIDDNLFAFSYEWKNIDYFVDENLKWVLNLKRIRKENYDLKTEDEWYKKSLLYISWQAWYIEIEQNWVYNMYEVDDVDTETWKFKLWKKVDIFTKEYYTAWEKIWFYYRLLQLNVSIELPNKKIEEEKISRFIKDKVIRIKDLEGFKNQWQISEEMFKEFLPKAKELLEWQIKDSRFWDIWKQITMEELKYYLDKNFITQSEFDKLSKTWSETKQKRELKKKAESDLIQWTKTKLAELKWNIDNLA